MDNKRRLHIIELAKKQGISRGHTSLPVVTLEDFFTGNDDPGSIGPNTENPGPEYFEKPLFSIRTKPKVLTVLVEIAEIEESDDTVWPVAERIYVLTSASQEEVAGWLSSLHPDAVEEGWANDVPDAAPELKPGLRVVSARWE